MLTVIAKGEQRLLYASCLIALAAFTPQGRCKPNAMELVPIAEAQPVLACFACKITNLFSIIALLGR